MAQDGESRASDLSTRAWSKPPVQLGEYRIEGEVGRGGMGIVYAAHDPNLDRRVAIKVLPSEASGDEAMRRFEREARLAARLNHPNIATIHALGQAGQIRFIAMEYVEGQSLCEALKRTPPLSLDEALDIATQIAEGLAAAHQRGIVHRDLKPGNVMITREGRAKILDFGLAKTLELVSAATRADRLTTVRAVVGTPGHMSPEQASGGEASLRSDVFSFGIMLYEMVTGRRPFEGDTPAELAGAVLRDPHTPARQVRRGVVPELDALIDKCLEKDPEVRYATASALLGDLRRARESRARATEGGPSIAVLPFVNLSADPENEYFTDGVAEEIITALTKIEALRVASRTSSFAFRDRREDIRKIGGQLGVRSVLEGSVRKSGDRLRITAQLINVADGYHLWTERFDRNLEDVFAIQDEIAASVADALQVVLTERERRVIAKAATTDVKAYDFYLRGRQFFRLRRKSLEFAVQMFQRAIDIDSEFALSWAGIATSCALLFMWWDSSEEVILRADKASERALALDPELSEAHVARGVAVWLRGEASFGEVSRHFEKAIELDSKSFDAHYFYARACFGRRRYEDAIRLFKDAARVRPEDYQAQALLTLPFEALGRYEEARAAARRAITVIERHLELNPDDSRAVYLGANAWARVGEPTRALEWAERALALDSEEPTVLYAVACVQAQFGNIEEAVDLMERAAGLGYGFREWWDNDPQLDPIRDHSRFKALLERM